MKKSEVFNRYYDRLESETEFLREIYENPNIRSSILGSAADKLLASSVKDLDESGFYPLRNKPTPILEFICDNFELDVEGCKKPTVSMTNILLGRQMGLKTSNPSGGAVLSGYASKNSCAYAENYFRAALMNVNGNGWAKQNRVSVYCDKDLTPLALRKSFEASSALTLHGLKLPSGVVLPPGTIVGIDNNCASEMLGETRHSRTTYTTYKVEGPLMVSPARLSAWAFEDQVDRALFGIGDGHCDMRRARNLAELTIEDFRDAANTVLSFCGVEAT